MSRLRLLSISALVHMVVTIVCIVHSYAAGVARFDDPALPEGFLEQVTAAAARVLALPVRLVWGRWASENLPDAAEWLAMALNSILWGAAVAAIARAVPWSFGTQGASTRRI